MEYYNGKMLQWYVSGISWGYNGIVKWYDVTVVRYLNCMMSQWYTVGILWLQWYVVGMVSCYSGTLLEFYDITMVCCWNAMILQLYVGILCLSGMLLEW